MKLLLMRLWLAGSMATSPVLAAGPIPPALQPAQPGGAQAPPAQPASGDESLIQLNFPENVEVKILIDYVAKRLGMNLVYDDGAVRKRISILTPAKVPKDSLLGLLQSVLKATGLAMVDGDQPGWKRIVPAQSLVAVTPGLARDPSLLAGTERSTPVTQVFQLKHVTTAALDPILKPFLGTAGSSSLPVPDRGMLIITDYADNLRRIADVINMFDRPAPETTIRFVPVQNWDAPELATQVTNLLREKQRTAGGDKAAQPLLTITSEPRSNRLVIVSAAGADAAAMDLVRELDVATTAETRTFRFRNVSPARIDRLARDFAGSDARQRYRSTVDEQSGLLIVTAGPHVQKHIDSLAKNLDVAVAEDEKPVRFYKLLNTTASEVMATIRSLEKGPGGLMALATESTGQPSGMVPPSPVPPLGTGPNRPPPALGEELPKPPGYKPPADEKAKTDEAPKAEKPGGAAGEAAGGVQTARTKDAIVTADPNTNTLIVVAPPAVQRVYEQLIKMLDRRRPQVMIEVTLVTLDTTDNKSFGVEISGINVGPKTMWLTFSQFGLSTPDLATGKLAMSPGTGLNGTVVDAGVFSAVVRALVTNGHARVVSAPRILVNDNTSGSISSVAEAPFTSVNASNTVSTTSFAGYASAGTTITVTPHISQGDHLLITYSVTLNSFTGSGSGGIPPPRQTDTVNSAVTVPDGSAVIIGGLTRRDTSDTVSKIPLFGDIPGLGALFSNRSSTVSQTTLFVFLRPVILRDDQFEDLRYLSDQALETAGFPANFPKSEPMMMN